MLKRNTTVILSAAFALFASFAVVFYWDYADYAARISRLGETEHTITIQANGSSAREEDVVSAFMSLSEVYELSLFRCFDTISEEGRYETFYSGVFYWDTFPVGQLGLLNGFLPVREGEFLASYTTGELDQTGVVYDFAGGNPVVVRVASPEPLSRWQRQSASKSSLDGQTNRFFGRFLDRIWPHKSLR